MDPTRSSLSTGAALHALAARLYPIPRSIAGPGVRATLDLLAEHAPIARRSIPSGTPVLDWTVPREWHLRSARLTAPDGAVVADAAVHNLHVLNFSRGFRGRLSLEELSSHLFSLPDRPDRIPYRTSYYREQWGFCLPHRVVQALPPGDYEVAIDAEHVDGRLDYGEALLPGESAAEVLFSTHCCHPQMANDNLSGLVVLTALAAELAARPRRRHTFRLLFAPGTIGAIAWLATHEDDARRVKHGLVVAGLGDPGGFHYKRSRRGGAPIDFAVPRALARLGEPCAVSEFVPFGYDERQYNSPGFDLPVGSLSRSPWGSYPEYHTDADDLAFVTPAALERALDALRAVVDELEARAVYRNRCPRGEPMLGRRGLYRAIGGDEAGRERELALLWVLNLADGEHDLATIAERARLPAEAIRAAADALLAADLLEPLELGDGSPNPETPRKHQVGSR
jgi:aminopeptidase-like protein